MQDEQDPTTTNVVGDQGASNPPADPYAFMDGDYDEDDDVFKEDEDEDDEEDEDF